ncbi:sensor domain-containing diguanylate cyclase [Colwellia psychrerythraea]|uniref:Sensory box/GGDEF domain protein n=1 Tax=Colwellia psychrerythraea (strain 34H / ATCC BAA-681) TaxID=167879 RepID=Q486E7_COLP3|nr:diguanylate cyclase [Colwellia psychrerythraea]AAZ24563.1 sensory box/GGDEF domain protein [Colwellia psychrerythraea 34H]
MFFLSDHDTLISSIEAIGASFAVFEFDPQSVAFELVSCNSRYEDLMGYSSAKALGQPLTTIFPRYIHNPLKEAFIHCKNERIALETEIVLDYKGQERCWRSIVSPIVNSADEKFRIIQTCVEITEKKVLEKQLNLSMKRFEAVVNNAYDGIITIDEQQNVKLFNEAAQSMFGYSEQEIMGQPLTKLLPEKYQAKHHGYVEGFKRSQVDSRPMQTRAAVQGLRKDGSEFAIEVTISKIRIADNVEFTAVIRDISEKNQLLEELILSSRRDPLTELYNRRYFTELLHSEITRSRRFKRGFSLLMLDIDHFKSINDRYGHACGDAALIAFSKAVTNSIREVDTICRWGGEEFLVLLPEIPKVTAMVVAEKIRKNIENLETIYEGDLIKVTVSIGLEYFSGDAIEMSSMINKVDQILYRAKDTGRNKISTEI